jgi:hypothetical protein
MSVKQSHAVALSAIKLETINAAFMTVLRVAFQTRDSAGRATSEGHHAASSIRDPAASDD